MRGKKLNKHEDRYLISERVIDCQVTCLHFNSKFAYSYNSITCIKRPLKGSNKSGLLQQVVFKCRFY